MYFLKHWLQQWKTRRANRKLSLWCAQHEMVLNGPMGFTIEGNLVRDFDYLLAYYSGNRIQNFDDFALISKHANALRFIIRQDYEDPVEHKQRGLGLVTARANLDRLIRIVDVIDDYEQVSLELRCSEQSDMGCPLS